MRDPVQQMKDFKRAGMVPGEGSAPARRVSQPSQNDCNDGLDFIASQVQGKTLEEIAPDLLRLSSCRLRKLLMRFSNAKSA